MTITASACKTVPLRADLLAATAVLARKAGRGPRLDQSSSIDKAALDCIYPLIRRRSIKQSIGSTSRHFDRVATRSKSP